MSGSVGNTLLGLGGGLLGVANLAWICVVLAPRYSAELASSSAARTTAASSLPVAPGADSKPAEPAPASSAEQVEDAGVAAAQPDAGDTTAVTADAAPTEDADRTAEAEAAPRAAAASTDPAATVVVRFDLRDFGLDDAARAQIKKAAKVANGNPNLMLHVLGHTDRQGSSDYNWTLGYRRAAEVTEQLKREGVSGARIRVRSRGATEPVSDAAAGNRRVEIRFRERH